MAEVSSQPSKGRASKRLTPAQLLWNELVGQDRECIPSNRLPTNRVIMQRYKSLKGTLPQSTPVRTFAKQLYEEVAKVWAKANIPIKSQKAVVESVTRLLLSWSTFSANAHKCKPESNKYKTYSNMLDSLCDLTEGDEDKLKEQMRSSRLPTWERDFEFYMNMKAGITNDQMDGIDRNAAKRQKTILSERQGRKTEGRRKTSVIRVMKKHQKRQQIS